MNGDRNSSGMPGGAMFPQIHSLPCAEVTSMMGYGNHQPVCGEYITDMCGHIVRALVPVSKHWVAIRNQPGKKCFQIPPDSGVCIFI